MVVVEDRVYSVRDSMVGLPEAYVQGEESMDDGEHQKVELSSQETSNPESGLLPLGLLSGRAGDLRCRGFGR